MKCPNTWKITKAKSMKNDIYFTAISKQLKMPPFMRGSRQFHFRICTYQQNWFQYVQREMLCYRLSLAESEKRKPRKREAMCDSHRRADVSFMEQLKNFKLLALLALFTDPAHFLWIPFQFCHAEPGPEASSKLPWTMLLWVRTENQMSLKATQGAYLAQGCTGCCHLAPGLVEASNAEIFVW